jgi:hypothetical protein
MILTTSKNTQDLNDHYQNGGGYAAKPIGLEEFTDSIKAVVDYWFDPVLLPSTEGMRI